MSIGRKLKETRIKRGIALSDVARDTLIQEEYLDAIENDLDDVIPSGSFKRVYTRAYCKYLGIEYVNEPLPERYEPPDETPIRKRPISDIEMPKRFDPDKKTDITYERQDLGLEMPFSFKKMREFGIDRIFRMIYKTLILLLALYIIGFGIVKFFQWIFSLFT